MKEILKEWKKFLLKEDENSREDMLNQIGPGISELDYTSSVPARKEYKTIPNFSPDDQPDNKCYEENGEVPGNLTGSRQNPADFVDFLTTYEHMYNLASSFPRVFRPCMKYYYKSNGQIKTALIPKDAYQRAMKVMTGEADKEREMIWY